MKYLLPYLGCIILVFSCKKEVDKPESEQLQGYSSKGNLLVFEVADTFINAYEYNFDTNYYAIWDSMPIRTTYYQYIDSLGGLFGWFQVKNSGTSIGYFSPNQEAAYSSDIFPVFYTEWDICNVISQNELIINQTQVDLIESKFSEYYINFNQEIREAWNRVSRFRVTIQYRSKTPSSQVGVFKKELNSGETRYYFFLAKY